MGVTRPAYVFVHNTSHNTVHERLGLLCLCAHPAMGKKKKNTVSLCKRIAKQYTFASFIRFVFCMRLRSYSARHLHGSETRYEYLMRHVGEALCCRCCYGDQRSPCVFSLRNGLIPAK